MRGLFFLLLYFLVSHAIETSSNITLQYLDHEHFADEALFKGVTKLKIQNDFVALDTSVEYLYSSEYGKRRYVMLNEFYLSKEYEEYGFEMGRIVRFMGELEGFNIVDVLNQKSYLLDPFDKSAKIGSYMLSFVRYFNEQSIEFGAKLYEEAQKYPTPAMPYSPFVIEHDDRLLANQSAYAPTLYLLYSLENVKLMAMHGYDNKRYFIPISQNRVTQQAYRVNKFLLSSNYLYEDYILKLESTYTDVIKDRLMGDYAQLSFGAERSFYDMMGIDISLYAEYYRYFYLQESLKNVDISELYDNDIFVALRMNFNDVGASEIKGGVLHDLQKGEKLIKIEARSRIGDSFVFEGEFVQILPKARTLLEGIGETMRLSFGITYTF